MRSVVFTLCLALALACGDDGSGKDESTDKDDQQKTDPQVSVPDTEEALKNLMTSLVSDVRSGNGDRAAETLQNLALPKPRDFFMALYSDAIVDRLVEDYGDAREHLPELADIIRGQLDKGRATVVVESFDDPNDRKSVGYQSIALREMRNRKALYSVRLVGKEDGDSFHIWSFMHDGEGFRWVGKLLRVKADIPKKSRKRLELRTEQSMLFE